MFRKLLFVTVMLMGLTSTQQASAIEESSLLKERATRTYAEMLDVRVIRALVVESKTNYFFDGPQQRGISYDLLKTFEKQVNKDLESGHLKVHVVFLPVKRDELIHALLEGRGDIAVANLTVTPERQAQVDFSRPLYKNARELVVTGAGEKPMSSINEIAGRDIYVRKSSSYYNTLLRTNERLAQRDFPAVNIVAADERLEDEDLLEMVNAGLIPAVVIDSHKAHFWEQIFDDIFIHEELALGPPGQIAWAFRKDSPQLEEVVNRFVAQNRKGSLMGNILFKRYLQSTRYLRNALDEEEMVKFRETVELFKKYATEYGFDWLMLMAQAYQESRLDQATRSPAGAIGVMQLLPSTAADKSVGIPDIQDLENNIHAGARYMRWLRDNYFNDPDMSLEEQTLFAFAAYNAGPGKVRRLRREAAEEGLDPDIWFDNVEVIAARRIGRETVQYVSNIYKYWIAYKLAFEEVEAAPG